MIAKAEIFFFVKHNLNATHVANGRSLSTFKIYETIFVLPLTVLCIIICWALVELQTRRFERSREYITGDYDDFPLHVERNLIINVFHVFYVNEDDVRQSSDASALSRVKKVNFNVVDASSTFKKFTLLSSRISKCYPFDLFNISHWRFFIHRRQTQRNFNFKTREQEAKLSADFRFLLLFNVSFVVSATTIHSVSWKRVKCSEKME